MKPAMFSVLLPWAMLAHAQSSAPPPMPPESKAKPAPAAPRPKIELSPAERQAIDARELRAVKPASLEDALQPTPGDTINVERDDAINTTRIEQTRISNRISEVIVTPAGTTRSYTMTNREGKQPFGTTQMAPGLSVPNLFRLEFGRPAPTPPAPLPPPASPAGEPVKPSN
ncbi:MAG: hypothetical protein ABJA83_05905 [Burkholderiaceae bacterium]